MCGIVPDPVSGDSMFKAQIGSEREKAGLWLTLLTAAELRLNKNINIHENQIDFANKLSH